MDTEKNVDKRDTPTSLMTVFAKAFNIDPDKNNFVVQGIYQDRKRRSYSGYYFDRLKDGLSGQIITLKLPEKLKKQMINGDWYSFKGILDKDVRWDGVIEPVFLVTELVEQNSDYHWDGLAIRNKLLAEKASYSPRHVEPLLQNILAKKKQPKIALICGKTSIVLQDLYSAMVEARPLYLFSEYRINLLDRKSIIRALTEIEQSYDIVAVVRGGGPGLEIFDDVRIAETTLQLKQCFVTAIGHAQDNTLLQQMADLQFTTPTAFGTFLRETAVADKQQSISKLNEPNRSIPENRLVYLILAGLIVLMLGILLGWSLG